MARGRPVLLFEVRNGVMDGASGGGFAEALIVVAAIDGGDERVEWKRQCACVGRRDVALVRALALLAEANVRAVDGEVERFAARVVEQREAKHATPHDQSP